MDSYSVIIPAFNEEELLPATLRALEAARRSVEARREVRSEVIVVDNNSTDRTAEIARESGAMVVFEPVNQISRARNAGARAASGRYLIFLDADTVIRPELLETALTLLAGGSCAGGGTIVAFDRPEEAGRKLVAIWNWVSRRLRLAAGCFIFCLREGFDAAGGFSESVYASEEIWFSRRLKAWGKKRRLSFRVLEVAPVVTSSRKLDWYSPLNLIGLFLLLAVFPPAVRFRRLCSHWYKRPARTAAPQARESEARVE